VIGPGVNLTSRIERLCRELERNLLMSEDFVTLTPRGGYQESNGLHQSQDLLQWSTPLAICDCRQLLPPMSPVIQVSH
jgi:class 3 adenylate cyclase